MIGTRDFHQRVRVDQSGRPVRWWKRRSFGMESDGLWGMIEKDRGPLVAYHRGIAGWTASVSLFGRSALVGRMQKMEIAPYPVHEDDEEVW